MPTDESSKIEAIEAILEHIEVTNEATIEYVNVFVLEIQLKQLHNLKIQYNNINCVTC